MEFGVDRETQCRPVDVLRDGEDHDVYEILLPARGPPVVVSHRCTDLICDLVDDRIQAVPITRESRKIKCRRWAGSLDFISHPRTDDEVDLHRTSPGHTDEDIE